MLGVSGSIAAYKSAVLVRLLVKAGAEVKVVMTKPATRFITPLTLATLAKNPVGVNYIADEAKGVWENHVELGLWADLMLVAPASAKTLSAFAQGHCDNLLTAVYLSAKCPVILAPAMDLDMFAHPSTRNNLNLLQSYGNVILDSPAGDLASGLSGQGRMQEPENIVSYLDEYWSNRDMLSGKTVLITAGPTYEAIDPVRYIGNASSGKMGFALASACLDKGARVILVTGPVNLELQHPRLTRLPVTSADEMFASCKKHFQSAHITIFAAAVADYKPAHAANQKLKKTANQLAIELTRNIDIAATLGREKKEGQITVGFALETENEEENAVKKLEKKNFDALVLNSLNDEGAGFNTDTNKISIFSKMVPTIYRLPLKKKSAVANDIINYVGENLL